MDKQATDRLEKWMDAYGTDVKRFCMLQLRDHGLAEDAVQDVFVKAWKARDTFRGECSEKTWLIRIAVNTCRDYQRSGWFRFMDRSTTPDGQPEQGVEDPFPDRTVSEAVAALSDSLRPVVLLRYYEQLTLHETALALRISDATVKRRLKKAGRQLHRMLEGWYEDEK